MLEVFDELGVKPSLIVGCSIGALIGAGYAGGMTGAEIREHALRTLSTRVAAARHIFRARKARLSEIFAFTGMRSFHLDGCKLAEVFMPSYLPKNIEDCGADLGLNCASSGRINGRSGFYLWAAHQWTFAHGWRRHKSSAI